MREPIRVLVADDHGVMRDGLRMLINSQQDMMVVAEVEDAPSVVATAGSKSCDVVVLDLSMPGGGGLDVIGDLTRNCKVVVLTMHEQPAYLRKAIAAGAQGYIAKRVAGTQLLDAIRTVHGGGQHIDPSIADQPPPEPKPVPVANDDAIRALSPREREVLWYVASGHTNQEAANQLGLSVKTVEGYRSRVTRKLGARGRADLVRIALSAGLLDDTGDLE